MTRTALALSDLRTIDLFDDIDDDALAEWLAVSRPRDVAAGDIVAAVKFSSFPRSWRFCSDTAFARSMASLAWVSSRTRCSPKRAVTGRCRK